MAKISKAERGSAMTGKRAKRKPRKPRGEEIGIASVRVYTPQQNCGKGYEVCLHVGYNSTPSFSASEARRLAALFLKFADWAESKASPK